MTTPKKQMMESISKTYAGRASSSAIIDLFITLLSMGLSGYKRILETRQSLIPHFTTKFHEVATKYGARLLSCPKNTISFAITLDPLATTNELLNLENLDLSAGQKEDDGTSMNKQDDTTPCLQSQDVQNLQSISKAITYFGSMLFTRCVSGTRVVPVHETKEICGHRFRGYGSSTNEYPYSYLTAACAIGLTKAEMDEFFTRLDKCFHDYFASKAKTKLGSNNAK